MEVDSLASIQQCGERLNALEQIESPGFQFDVLSFPQQLQPGSTTFFGDLEEILIGMQLLITAQARAVLQRAKQQKRIEKAHLDKIYSRWHKWIDIQAAHFHVLNAP
ncbi:hypothetical protein D3C72_1817550 [compost metagenome]